MKLFLAALGLALIMEGLPYFAFPEKIKGTLIRMMTMPAKQLRILGFLTIFIGALLIYLSQRGGL